MVGERISNAPLRKAFLASGLTSYEVAKRVGWMRSSKGRRSADGGEVTRVLGLRVVATTKRGRRYGYRAATISSDRALALADALGIDPREAGL